RQVTGNIETPFSVDRWTFVGVAGQQVQFDLVNSSSPAVRFSLSGPTGFAGFTDIPGDSSLVNLTASGTYSLTARGTGGDGGAYAFRMLETSQVDLTPGTPYAGTLAGSGQAQLFRVIVPTAQSLAVHLDDSTNSDGNELYAKFGTPPTRSDYDYR